MTDRGGASARALAALVSFACAGGCGPLGRERTTTGSTSGAPPAALEPSAADAGGDSPPAEGEEAALQAMLARVSALRGLRALEPVRGRVLDRDALLRKIRERVERELPPAVLAAQGDVLFALSLVPASFQFEEEMYRLLEAQVAGYYEPFDRTMYLAADVAGMEADLTLAHELIHALQDQHFDLDRFMRYRPGQADVSAAVHLLAEGDATSGALDVLAGSKGAALALSAERFAMTIALSLGLSPGAAGSPRVLRASLTAPYIDGFALVNELRRRDGWSAVDAVWRAPPASTEQALHADKLEAREPPIVLAAPDLGPLGVGYRVALDDTMGEQGLRIVLEEWAPRRVAARAAAGWGGDRYVLARREGEAPAVALVWHLRFDGARDAEEAFEVFSAGVDATRERGERAKGDAKGRCGMRGDRGALAIARRGSDVAVVAGPFERRGEGPKGLGTCAAAEAHAARIAGGGKRVR